MRRKGGWRWRVRGCNKDVPVAVNLSNRCWRKHCTQNSSNEMKPAGKLSKPNSFGKGERFRGEKKENLDPFIFNRGGYCCTSGLLDQLLQRPLCHHPQRCSEQLCQSHKNQKEFEGRATSWCLQIMPEYLF